jgi:hypothetical protein
MSYFTRRALEFARRERGRRVWLSAQCVLPCLVLAAEASGRWWSPSVSGVPSIVGTFYSASCLGAVFSLAASASSRSRLSGSFAAFPKAGANILWFLPVYFWALETLRSARSTLGGSGVEIIAGAARQYVRQSLLAAGVVVLAVLCACVAAQTIASRGKPANRIGVFGSGGCGPRATLWSGCLESRLGALGCITTCPGSVKSKRLGFDLT